jgi:antibiotic biosynthesis monooxygenase (ABM) superfamily enzyme
MAKWKSLRGSENVFVNIIEFPPIKKGKDEEFKKWFEWSNTVYGKFDGFISRRLLKSTKGKKTYAAIVEHKNEKTFMTMHRSDERQKAWAKVEPLLNGSPKPHFYEVMQFREKMKTK